MPPEMQIGIAIASIVFSVAALVLSVERACHCRPLVHAPEATREDAMAEWATLPDGAEFVPSPVDPGGVMLVLTPQGLLNLRVDRAGRLSSTGFRLQLRLPEAERGAHAG